MAKQIPHVLQCGCFGFQSRNWTAEARGTTTLTQRKLDKVMENAACAIHHWDPDEWLDIASLQEAGQSRASVTSMQRKVDSLPLAVKRLPNRWIKDGQSEFEQDHPQASEKPWVEIGLLRYLNALGFPYVCELIGIFRDEEFTYVATSLASEGDLFQWVEQTSLVPGMERESIIRQMLVQLFSAVYKLHELGIAHRDLSLENVLLTSSAEGYQIKLIDFGMATLSQTCGAEIRGKKAYQAPEMHTDPEYDSFLADVFALGVVVYAMALSDYPWTATKLGTCKLFDFIHTWGFAEFIKKRTCRRGPATYIEEVLSAELVELLEGLMEPREERLCLGESYYRDTYRWSAWNMAWMEGTTQKRSTCLMS
ncbi:unnamed protein product [Effrenium voratum]|uniref:Protein kinase domain-containing protein n=1 Tax=Effrenium voratum TaxID=2562239 RepID=A0AA36IFC8_9DINO|nr:unnamed protein product [Effrenium voratum]CAJ1447659.1 unnamed protein product [Effrenium voratum]